MGRIYRFASVIIGIIFFAVIIDTVNAYASDNSILSEVKGKVYEFNDGEDYSLNASDASKSVSESNAYGIFTVSGALSTISTKDGLPSYGVNGVNLTLSYTYDDKMLKASEDQKHLVDDKSKSIDNIKFNENMLKGAVVLQTSRDGRIWYDVNETKHTNVFADTPKQEGSFYNTTEIQMVNGCYYRFIVVYKTAIKTDSSKFLFIKKDNFENHRYVEIYTFYAYDETAVDVPEPSSKNERQLIGSVKRAAKFEGYAGTSEIDNDDPHSGWEIGQFFVGGFSDKNVPDENGDNVFLKNSGDRVSLWFELGQNIDRCCNNENIKIVADTKGYDQEFDVPGGVNETMDFGRGVLIIRKTNPDGTKDKPQIYTNFLEASASPDAVTKINLFEEGDYEGRLDYAVRFDRAKILDKSILPQTNHYRIDFKFSVRNGNAMFFMFDNKTGSELTDGDITPNGFRIDLANSKYLKLNVRREVLNDGFDGLTEDTRFNSTVNDGYICDKEGIYTITVINRYNDATTEKRVYVGNDNILKAYMVTGLTISEIKDKVAMGAVIEENGTITEPVSEAAINEVSADAMTDTKTEAASSNETTSGDISSSGKKLPVNDLNKTTIIPILVVIVIILFILVIWNRRAKSAKIHNTDDLAGGSEDDKK